jgi:hypothetical protein
MTAVPVEAARRVTLATPESVALLSSDNDPLQVDPLQGEAGRVTATRRRSGSCTLDLSRSRTHDAALDILKAYKLSGNFHRNLEAVLREMGVFDTVTYRIEPNPILAFPDCRHVVFMLNENVPSDMFDNVIRSITVRIGFDPPWWGTLLRRVHPEAAGADPMCRTSPHY